MNNSTPIFSALTAAPTGQALVSHAGLRVLSSFLNALDFRKLSEGRLTLFVPVMAKHRPGNIIADLVLILAAGGE